MVTGNAVTGGVYSQPREMTTVLVGRSLRVITKPGFAHWDQITPACRLLAESTDPTSPAAAPPEEILVMGGGHGALAAALAQQQGVGSVWLTDTTLTALAMAERTMHANGVEKGRILDDPLELAAHPARFDRVYMELPKGRRFARRWLVEAHAALKAGGRLFLAGANGEGIQAVAKDARSLFGNGAVLGYKKGSRVVRMVKATPPGPLPGWASEPGIQPGTWIEFEVQVRGVHLHLASLPGVFSADRLDEGSAFLLERLELPAGGRVLDAGCGYGVIGLYAGALGAELVDMVDNHLLSIACARGNIARNAGVQNHLAAIRAFPADALDFTPNYGYTQVISNPPFHAGKAVDTAAAHAFIAQAHQLLEPGGQLILVANRFLRYDRLMENLFGNLSRPAESGKYHILTSIKRVRAGKIDEKSRNHA